MTVHTIPSHCTSIACPLYILYPHIIPTTPTQYTCHTYPNTLTIPAHYTYYTDPLYLEGRLLAYTVKMQTNMSQKMCESMRSICGVPPPFCSRQQDAAQKRAQYEANPQRGPVARMWRKNGGKIRPAPRIHWQNIAKHALELESEAIAFPTHATRLRHTITYKNNCSAHLRHTQEYHSAGFQTMRHTGIVRIDSD